MKFIWKREVGLMRKLSTTRANKIRKLLKNQKDQIDRNNVLSSQVFVLIDFSSIAENEPKW